jgi:hypothetical protein
VPRLRLLRSTARSDQCAGNQSDGRHVPQVLGIVIHDERRNVHGVHGDAARRVHCVDTLEYAVQRGDHGGIVIETPSEPVEGHLKQITSCH